MNETIRRKLRLGLRKFAGEDGLRHRFVHRAWNTYEHIVFEYHTRRNIREADPVAPLYPRRLYWVDPKSVTHYISGKYFDMLRDTGSVVGGDWDVNSDRLVEDTGTYQTFVEHFENGIPWEEIESYQRKLKKVRSGNSKRYPTVEAFERKYTLYDRLYNTFSQSEYLTQKELTNNQATTGIGDGGHAFFPLLTGSSIIRHEITVNVGRDGTLFLDDGSHRLLIARIAGLENVPIRIVARHELWQEIRDMIVIDIRDDQLDKKMKNGTYPVKTHHDSSTDRVSIEHPDVDVLLD